MIMDYWRSMESDRLDWGIRVLWSEHAAKVHDWPYRGVPPNDVATGKFLTSWHETDYQMFKAGYLAALKQQDK